MNNVICLCLSPSLARGPSGHPCELESWIWSPGYKPEINKHKHSLKVILGKRSVSGSLNTRTWDLAAGTLSNGAAWPGVVRYDVLAMTLVGPVCRSVPLIFTPQSRWARWGQCSFSKTPMSGVLGEGIKRRSLGGIITYRNSAQHHRTGFPVGDAENEAGGPPWRSPQLRLFPGDRNGTN